MAREFSKVEDAIEALIDARVIHGHGLEIVAQVPIIAADEAQRRRYPSQGA